MLQIASLGYPSVGIADVIALWRKGAIDDWRLAEMVRAIRLSGWAAQRAAGIDLIASGEVGLGDPIAETAAMVGAVPARFGPDGGRASLEDRLALAGIGSAETPTRAPWAGSHLSYARPMIGANDRWRLSSAHPVAEQLEAASSGICARPVLVGPISFLMHCRTENGASPLDFLDRVLPAYREILDQLAIHGAEWVQVDEPALAGNPGDTVLNAFSHAYQVLSAGDHAVNLLIAIYGGSAIAAIGAVAGAPVHGLHLDLAAAPDQLATVADQWPADRVLSIGVIDAVSPRPTDLPASLRIVRAAMDRIEPARLQIAPSRPLTVAPTRLDHAPLDQVRNIETAADKLRVLRRLADAALTGSDPSIEVSTLPDLPNLSPAMLGDRPVGAPSHG